MPAFPHWRQELFFKTQQQLQDQTAFVKEYGVRRLNVTNKSDKDDLLATIQHLRAGLGPQLDVCVHYSMKFQSTRDNLQTFAKLDGFCASLKQSEASVLLCSGGGKRKSLGSVEALQHLASKHKNKTQLPPLYVCFNPYLPESEDRQAERQRLKVKLATGLVTGVYLQMGSCLKHLEEGLQFLQEQRTASGHAHNDAISILGSMFVPSKKLLAQQKFRPWSGVFLVKEYLDSVEGARDVTLALLSLYRRFGVVPLVETAVKDSKGLREVMDLFEEAVKQDVGQ